MNLQESADFLLINQSRLAQRFYDLLFTEHPEMKPFFDGVDMAKQRERLVSALTTIQRHAKVGGWVSENYLRGLGKKHVTLGIKAEMFPGFIDTLIKVVAELHEDDWSWDLESEWRYALDASLKLMLTAYEPES